MIVKYISSENQKIDLIADNVKILNATFRKSEWNPIVQSLVLGDKVLGFSKKSQNFIVDLIFLNLEYFDLLDKVDFYTEIFEKDIMRKRAGKLLVDDWEIDCFVISTEPTQTEGNAIGKRFKIYAPYPFWTKETTYMFKSSEITSTNNKRYPGRYGYRYANGLNNTSINNNHYVESNFKLLIYGKCINPTIIIGGHIYKVHTLIEEGERLEIDSINRTVVKVRNSGYVENLFNSRDKENYIFQKIPSGLNSVNWSGDFDFDIILYEERSEPKWI